MVVAFLFIFVIFLSPSVTASAGNMIGHVQQIQDQNELVIEFNKLAATVQQQSVSIEQLTQRIDRQEEMLNKAREEIEILRRSNPSSKLNQKLFPSSLVAASLENETMETAADDPSINSKGNSRDDSSASSSWAQLEISPNIVGSVHYANFRINIYEHAKNTKIEKTKEQSHRQCYSSEVENKKYYYVPICMLDSNSARSSYNNVTNRPEMTFWIELWNHQVEKAVTDWIKRNFKDEIISNQIEVMPFEKLIMTSASSSSEEQRNYYLDNAWISYQRQERVKFKFICYKLNDCDQLAHQMRLNPDQFSHLQLQFSMASVRSQTRETKIRVGNIKTGDMASKLLQRLPKGDFVLLKAEDEKRLISESATNIFIETFDDSDVVAPNSQAQISNQLKELLVSSRMTIKEQSDKMWDSVFWNEDNYRPDKTTRKWNEIYSQLDKDNQTVLASMFKSEIEGGLKLKFLIPKIQSPIGLSLGGSVYNENASFSESLDKLYEASKDSVYWDGEKFAPKPLTLAKVNHAKLWDEQSLQDRSVKLTYATAVLSVAINIPEHTETLTSYNVLYNIQLQLQELHSKLKSKSTPGPIPSNCTELSYSGHSLNGLYLVAGSRNRVKTVYCDFTRLPHSQDYQRDFGYNFLSEPVESTKESNMSIMPTNCKDLYKLGHRINGFYPVKNDDGFQRLDVIHCSFNIPFSSLSPVLDEFNRPHHDEKVIGYADIKSDPVFFHVTKKRRFFSTGQKVLFDNVVLNIGEAMDIGSGIFTAPRSGKYSFNFNGFKDALVGELCVVLKLNGQTDLASSYVGNANDRASQLAPIALHVITSLKANDQVSLYLKEGSIAGSSHGNNFSGFLIHQDLTFE